MHKKIFSAIFLTTTLLLIIANVMILLAVESILTKQAFIELKKEAKILETNISNLIENKIPNTYRISIIQENGEVIYDNTNENLQNHNDRVEIINAIINNEATSIRYSDTMKTNMLYFAKIINFDDKKIILRISQPKKDIENVIWNLLPYFAFEFILCSIICFFIARMLTKSIIKPLYKLNLENIIQKIPYTELKPLAQALKNEYKLIKNQLKGLKQKQAQMLLLTQNMSDGLVLLNKQGKILLANKKANEYFKNIEKMINIDEIDDHLFLQQVLLYLNKLKKDNQQQITTIKINNKECEVIFCPIHSKGKFRGIIIILRDIDALILAQNMRKEFSANVTHELKTPLTSIIASSEMINSNLVREKDLKIFIEKIEKEAKRLLEMIDEILKLSFLDENGVNITIDKINLKTITNSVLDRLQIIAKNKKITITSNLDNAYILGNKQLIENLIYNLCDNAIKYNKENGYIKINLQTQKSNIIFSIKDSGIGIPKEAQKRVFERFYCVDKSRSKNLGGTGLGLSIVKSVAKYHNAKIELNSKENKGSEFKITFASQA